MSKLEVDAIRAVYRGFTKSLLSCGRNPDYYGVELTKPAKSILSAVGRAQTAEEKPLPVRRKITIELSEREFAAFKRRAKMAGMKCSVWAKKMLLENAEYVEQTEVQAG